MANLKSNLYLYLLIGTFLTFGVILVTFNHYSTKAITGTRGFISGEGHWAKAQKNAILELIYFVELEDESHYDHFKNSLNVIKGDKQARTTLSSDAPDYEAAYQGFLQGDNHPDEIDSMIWLHSRFKNVSHLKNAWAYWETADNIIEDVEQKAEMIYEQIIWNQLSEADKNNFLLELYEFDRELSELERNFSDAVNEAALYIDSVIFRTILIGGLLIIIGGAIITLYSFRLVKKYYDQRNEAELKFKNILENSRDVIYLMDREGKKYEYISSSVKALLGYSVNEILKGGTNFIMDRVHPDDEKRMEEERRKFPTSELEKQIERDTEFRVRAKNGDYIWVNNKRSLLRDKLNNPIGIIGNVRDISAEVEYVEQINKSLKEKEVLLTEIHHRVKNNLAIISGLIELQKENVDKNTNVRNELEEIQSRIQSIVLVHEKLYQTETLSEISLKSYIEDLTGYIDSVLNDSRKSVRIEKNLDDVKLNIIHAVPFGILYNELIVNIFKHAFNGRTKQCMAEVKLEAENDKIILTVADNGIGLPDNIKLDEPETLGLTLIKALSDQLNGTLNIKTGDGTEFRFTFKLPGDENALEN